MTKINILFFILAATVLFIPGESFSGGRYKWELSSTNNGCKNYTSEVAGKKFIAAKSVGIVNAKMEVVGMVIRDIAGFPQWMGDCKGAKILKTLNDDKDIFIFHFHQGTPVIDDRDSVCITDVTLNYPKGYVLIKFHDYNNFTYPSPKGIIRMKSLLGQFLLEYVDREHTRVSFIIDPDLAGSVAGWIANPVIKGLPYKALTGLRKMVKKKKYIESAKKSKYKKLIEISIRKGHLKV